MANRATRRLARKRKRRAKSPGLSPGSLVFEGQRHLEKTLLTLTIYSPERLNTFRDLSLPDLATQRNTADNIWLLCTGIHDPDILRGLGQIFKIDNLTLEDILTAYSRPKYENFSEYLFICTKIYSGSAETAQFEAEQISLILGKGFVLTFQEKPSSLFDPVLKRLELQEGRLRQRPSDYLACALLDALVDSYFPIIDSLQDRIDQIDGSLVEPANSDTLQDLHNLKREIYMMQRNVTPLRDIINFAIRAEDSPFSESTDPYLRDTSDHILAIIDLLDGCREQCNNLIDLHFSLINSRTNEVIRFLTIVSSIFIPLTFVTSIYGMNFRFMPELDWPWGYPLILGVLFLIFLGFAFYLKRRSWL